MDSACRRWFPCTTGPTFALGQSTVTSHALRVQPLPSARATVTAARRAITFTWCILQVTLVPPAILSFPAPFFSTFEEPVFQRGCCATSSYLVSSLVGDLLTMPLSPLLHFNGMLRRELQSPSFDLNYFKVSIYRGESFYTAPNLQEHYLNLHLA